MIDASGTWTNQNPLGGSGLPAEGERSMPSGSPMAFPTCSAATAPRYAGKTVLVVGAGHSAANALLDLARLAEAEPATAIIWAVRGTNLSASMAAAKPTSCRRAASSAPT